MTTTIDMQQRQITCCVCGKADANKWGIPVSPETGLIIASDSPELGGAISACRKCYSEHAKGKFVGTDPRF